MRLLKICIMLSLAQRLVAQSVATCLTYRVEPPEWEIVEEKVLVRPQKYQNVAATFDTLTETVMIRPSFTRWIPIPATFERVSHAYVAVPEHQSTDILMNVTEIMEIAPEYQRIIEVPIQWYLDSVQFQRKPTIVHVVMDGETCREIVAPMELDTILIHVLKQLPTHQAVPIPAQYTTVTQQRILTKGSGGTLVPATYATHSKQILKTPATVREEIMEPLYQTRRFLAIQSPSYCREKPPVYQLLKKKRLIKPARFYEMPVACAGKSWTLHTIQVPAAYETIEIYDAQGKLDWIRRTEVTPAHVIYEVLEH